MKQSNRLMVKNNLSILLFVFSGLTFICGLCTITLVEIGKYIPNILWYVTIVVAILTLILLMIISIKK